MIFDGKVVPVKQCMPERMEIDVETVDFDNEEQTSTAFRAKRFLGILTVNQPPTSPDSGGGNRFGLGHSTGGGCLLSGNSMD